MKLTIPLPLPNSNSLSHGTGHWRKTASLRAAMREDARTVTIAAIHEQLNGDAPGLEHAVINYAFYWPDNRARDEANYISACKPYVDGIVDVGVMRDDKWQVLSTGSVTSGIDRTDPRVELVIESKGAGDEH